MSLNETDCQIMAEIATSSFLRTVLSTTTFLCICCIPFCLNFAWLIIHETRLHFNSKCIFVTFNISVLVHVSVRIILHGKDFLNYVGPWQNGCELFPDRSRCDLRKLYKLSAFAIEVTPFVLTVERFIATFRASNYENRYKWCGGLLTGFHVCLSMFLFSLHSSGKAGKAIIYYCWVSSTDNQSMRTIPILIVVVSQLITIPGLLYLLRKNERFRALSFQKRSTLSQRYQLSENLQTLTKFRIVSAVTWTFVTYNAAATFGVYLFSDAWSYAEEFAVIEIVHCLPLYYLILAACLIIEDKKHRNQNIIKVNNYEPQYFNHLQAFFDEAFEIVKSRSRKVKIPK